MTDVRQTQAEDIMTLLQYYKEDFPEYAKLTDDQIRYLATVNIATGIGESFYIDNQLVACGGIRHIGVGEAWMCCHPSLRGAKRLYLLRNAKESFARMTENANLWRVFSEAGISGNFLRHLGFEKAEPSLLWTRGVICQP